MEGSRRNSTRTFSLNTWDIPFIDNYNECSKEEVGDKDQYKDCGDND